MKYVNSMIILALLLNTTVFCIEFTKKYFDHSNSIITISQQDLVNNDAVFEQKMMQGIKDGIFYIEIPEQWRDLIVYALDFGNSFYNDEIIKNQKKIGFNGYHDRENVQVESFYIERSFWKKTLSKKINQLAININVLSEDLLKKILYLVVPQFMINQSARTIARIADNTGEYYFLFNHYRPEKKVMGLRPHKDFGFITLLYTMQQGFIARLKNVWGMVAPKENHFIVNLGSALELFVNDNSKLTSVLHAVERIKDQKGRVSFGLSIEGGVDSPLYKLSENNSLEIIHENYQSYLEECFKQTYDIINEED